MNKIETWLFNAFAGKVAARAAVSIAAYVAGPVIQGIANQAGIHVSIDPAELSTGMTLAGHAAFEWFKAWRLSKSSAAVPVVAPAP